MVDENLDILNNQTVFQIIKITISRNNYYSILITHYKKFKSKEINYLKFKIYIMGNNSSTSNLQIPTREFAYFNIVCSKCKLRCKSYYHNDCIRTYIETQLNGVFVCPSCNNNYNKMSQLLT